MSKHVGTIHESQDFGKFKIVEYKNFHNVIIEFLDTGWQTKVEMGRVNDGAIKDWMMPNVMGVGFFGGKPRDCKFKSSHPAYQVWSGMLERCYDESKHDTVKMASYRDVTIDPRWHNFQVFAQFYDDNYPKGAKRGEYHLDKDIKVPGNKVYSPETCQFVLAAVNTADGCKQRMYTAKVSCPKGKSYEVYNQTKFAKEHGLTRIMLNKLILRKVDSVDGWTLLEGKKV